jgi:hypothetical protein
LGKGDNADKETRKRTGCVKEAEKGDRNGFFHSWGDSDGVLRGKNSGDVVCWTPPILQDIKTQLPRSINIGMKLKSGTILEKSAEQGKERRQEVGEVGEGGQVGEDKDGPCVK